MAGPHYAISEALIVLAAIWCVLRLSRLNHWFAALGIAIFGFAAAIGVYRFGTNQIEELASFHKNFSQTGGSVAMALVSAQLLLAEPLVNRTKVLRWFVLLLVVVSSVTAFKFPTLNTPLFIAWLSVAIVSAALIPASTIARRVSLAAIVSIFLINLLLIRHSPQISPDISWHLFHILVAVWLLGMVYVFEYRRYEHEFAEHEIFLG
ncbi:hypothetical protein [Sphingorhabdus sp. EL138]|uniref:hypothetical protein n=1 Tax=Sphingorhabdus sp. EL138 TaxID=2073156 RepID=UPI000D699936|nr:hypothetical protein [Sphingorhabdus sp. EL138]